MSTRRGSARSRNDVYVARFALPFSIAQLAAFGLQVGGKTPRWITRESAQWLLLEAAGTALALQND